MAASYRCGKQNCMLFPSKCLLCCWKDVLLVRCGCRTVSQDQGRSSHPTDPFPEALKSEIVLERPTASKFATGDSAAMWTRLPRYLVEQPCTTLQLVCASAPKTLVPVHGMTRPGIQRRLLRFGKLLQGAMSLCFRCWSIGQCSRISERLPSRKGSVTTLLRKFTRSVARLCDTRSKEAPLDLMRWQTSIIKQPCDLARPLLRGASVEELLGRKRLEERGCGCPKQHVGREFLIVLKKE